MKRQIQLWGTRSLALVVLVIGIQHWGMPLYKQYFTQKKVEAFMPTTVVKEGELVISFSQSGALSTERSTGVVSEVSGKILTILPEGTAVKPGDKLAEIDTTEICKEVRQADIAYKVAKVDVDHANEDLRILLKTNENDIKEHEAQRDFDQIELQSSQKKLERYKRLAAQKLMSGSDVDAVEMEVRSKQLTLTKDNMDLDLSKATAKSKELQKRSDVASVVSRESNAKSVLDEVQGRVKNAVIRSTASGMVLLGRHWREGSDWTKYAVGDTVERHQGICELPDLSSIQVRVKVGEADISRVHIGMPTVVRLEAVPNRVFHGSVKTISALATETEPWDRGGTPGLRVFEVTVQIKEVDPKVLRPGISADTELICETLKKTVYVPMECVIERDSKTYVYVKNGKRFDRVDVKIGKHNDNFIAITKGLVKGQVIALRDPTRPLDEQEAKSAASEEKKKKSAPIPGGTKKK